MTLAVDRCSKQTLWCLGIGSSLLAFACAPEARTLPSGVRVEVLRRGTGDAASAGRYGVADYRLEVGGKTLDSTEWHGEPWVFCQSDDKLLPGLRAGIEGIRAGETRRIVIPPEQAYGSAGKLPQIPPKSTLIYEFTVLQWFSTSTSGCQYRVLKNSDRSPPEQGDQCVLRYRVFHPATARELDSSNKQGRALEFELGSGTVLEIIEEMVAQIPCGASWQVAVPRDRTDELSRSLDLLPRSSDLLIELELVGVR